MAKKKKNVRAREPQRRRPAPQESRAAGRHGAEEDHDLLLAVRQALRSEDPLDLLTVVSVLLEITDPRRGGPLGDGPRADRGELVASLLETSYAETTAALTVVRALVPDELLAARIGQELARRRHPLPDWLDGLAEARAEGDAWLLTHVLGDGDDVILEVRLPSGHALSAVVYVDHNLGGVVKDAFVVPAPVEGVLAPIRSLLEPGQSLDTIDPATARAEAEAAIDRGSRVHPPLKSESWPACRPLVEWMLRRLPAGGVAAERPEWSETDVAALAEAFLASPYGATVDHEDGRDLLRSLLWFATGYANGDPFRWSPVTIEMLVDWLPRKVLGDRSYLAGLPEVVRAFVGYAHDRVGIPEELTAETLVVLDAFVPVIRSTARSGRPQGQAALLADLLGEEGLGGLGDVGEEMLGRLADEVGGRQQLQDLDAAPLPDEPFGWAGVPEDVRPVVQEVLDLCDGCADELLDVEHRTAMRRFLARAAEADPAIFRRKASTARGAAAVAWVVCRASRSVGAGGLEVRGLLGWFGVSGSVAQRAEALLRANGVDPHAGYGSVPLGTPDLLTSTRRAQIMDGRDYWPGA